MMEGASASGRAVRWKDEVKMENLDQFVMETAPQVFSLRSYRYSHAESQNPRQRVSNADRKVFANPESFATSSLLAEEFPDTLQYKISR